MLDEDYEQITSSSIDWNRFSNKTVLITGANGFIGTHLKEYLNKILGYK